MRFTLLVLLLLLCACSRFQPVTDQQATGWADDLAVGDEVRIKRCDGTREEFTIETISDETLAGEGVELNQNEICELQVSKFHSGKTAIVAGMSLTAIYITLLVILAASVSAGL